MNQALHPSLEAFIARSASATTVRIVDSRLLSGGAIQENWLLDVEILDGPMAGLLQSVLRCDSQSAVSASHGRAQEFALLQAVFDAGVSVPEPLWLCTNKKILDRPFFIMRRVAGTAAAHLLTKNDALGGDRTALAERLGQELARIHSIRPPRSMLEFLPRYDEAPALYLIKRLRQALDRHHTSHPVLEWGLRWLERHAPAHCEVRLCHRDYRTGNYMVDESGLTGILDWEFAGWSDPLEDIGWFCAKCWRFSRNDREAGGIGQREDFYRGYERESGKPINRGQVRYWEVMAHVNWAMIAIQQAQRHSSGEEQSLLLALTGHIVPELEWQILNMTEAD